MQGGKISQSTFLPLISRLIFQIYPQASVFTIFFLHPITANINKEKQWQFGRNESGVFKRILFVISEI